MISCTDDHWFAQLDDESAARHDQRSFHVFAEGRHSDVRGQIFRVTVSSPVTLWTHDWPQHLFLVLGVSGEATAELPDRTVPLRALSQLVVLPGVPCRIVSTDAACIEIISLLSAMASTPAVDTRGQTAAARDAGDENHG